MAHIPSPRSGSPLPGSVENSPRSGPVQSHLPDRTIPSQPLDSQTSAQETKAFIPPWLRPSLAPQASDGEAYRRPSVQFVPQVTKDSPANSRSPSLQPSTRISKTASVGGSSRRLSSPPPPAQYRSSVSFDTFSNPSASDFSLTLNRKHKDYVYSKRSRTFLCGTDTNDYSDTALEWLIDELVDDGDEVVCLRVVEKDSKEALRWQGGHGERGYRLEAERFLESIEKKNTDDRAISIILEFAVGKVHDMIQRMIRIYEPAMLVVGTRGRSLTGYSGLLSSGSVSKYCLQHSPVPVIVVRPNSKREKKKRKRLRDPSRTGYRDILDKAEDVQHGKGGHLLDTYNRSSVFGNSFGALGALGAHSADEEARLVAQAIGYRASLSEQSGGSQQRSSSLSRVNTNQSATSTRSGRSASVGNEASPSDPPPDVRSPTDPGRLLKSPDIRDLDSPHVSDDEDVSDIEEELEPEIRPQDEAAMLAYERAQKIYEEQKEDAEARAKHQATKGRDHSKGGENRSRRGTQEDEEGGGAAVLGLLAQLDRGIK